jgi:cystathionine beta-lyase/cystathionine gamma-synthase
LQKAQHAGIYVETISNPLLNVAPLDRLASFARTAGLVSLIDNTMATPLLFRPLEWGYDLSLHSATKYLNGHSDIVGGALLGRREWVGRARTRLQRRGGSMDPHQCFLLARGVKTLALRLHRQSESAGALAAMIAKDSRVRSVRYPGLSNDASYANARRLLDGFGALLAFDLGSAAAAERFMGALGLAMHAPSFGGVETLVTRPALSSHASLSAAERESLGIGDGLVRLAAGIESTEDLLEDVRQALERLGEDV